MAIEKSPASPSFADVVGRVLDSGVVIDAFVRVSLAGAERLAGELYAAAASVRTWLKHAEASGLTVDPQAA